MMSGVSEASGLALRALMVAASCLSRRNAKMTVGAGFTEVTFLDGATLPLGIFAPPMLDLSDVTHGGDLMRFLRVIPVLLFDDGAIYRSQQFTRHYRLGEP